MIRSWLRVFFVVLIVVGGVWWYRGWKQGLGEITSEATKVEVEPTMSPIPEKIEEVKQHEPVEAGVGDWQWEVVWLGSFGVGLLMWVAYKTTYRLYWFG